jgi:O-antigen/teichoic acid export membrane protein
VGADIRRLASGSLFYGLGSAAVGALGFLLLPLYSRVLTPSEYGVVAVVASISAVLSLVLPLGLHGSVTRLYFDATSAEHRRRIVGAIWLAMVLFALAIAVVAHAVGSAVFGALFPSIPFYPYGALGVWAAFLSTFSRIPLVLLQIEERPREYVTLTVGTALVTTTITIYLVVVLGLGAAGYLAGGVIGSVAAAPAFVATTLRRSDLRWRGDVVRSALAYGTPLVPHALAAWTLELSDRAILQRFVSLAALGVYSLAYQFGVLMNVVGTAVNNAWTPFVFRRLNEGRTDAASSLSQIATYFTAAIGWVGLAIASLSGDAIALLTPPAFHGAIPLAPWIVFGCTIQALYYVPGNLVLAKGRTSRLAGVTGVAALTNVSLNLLLVPTFGVIAAAWATFASYEVMLVLAWAAGQQAFALKYQYPRLARIGLVVMLTFAGGRVIGSDGEALAILARVALVAAFPVFLVAAGSARHEEWNLVRGEAKALLGRLAVRAR